jgi:hypothetical protein
MLTTRSKYSVESYKYEPKAFYRAIQKRPSEIGEPGSSVSIMSGYGLDDWAIDVRSPAEAKGFFL